MVESARLIPSDTFPPPSSAARARLAELGWTIPQMAAVTGHRTWANLQRYTHLAGPEPVDKYAGWRFRPVQGVV